MSNLIFFVKYMLNYLCEVIIVNIETEFRHGIFFIRLKGKITDENLKINNAKITNMIIDNGFKNVVFNVEKLDYKNINKIERLIYNPNINNMNNLMICGFKETFESNKMFNYIDVVKDEISALKTINI